jgi:ABC-type spermidine/putrescine transport system permease subunit II
MSEWLMSMIEPMIARVLVSLGLGYVTFESINQILDGVISSVTTAMNSLGADVLQIITLYGLPEALGIILGGMVFALTLTSLKRLRFMPFSS